MTYVSPRVTCAVDWALTMTAVAYPPCALTDGPQDIAIAPVAIQSRMLHRHGHMTHGAWTLKPHRTERDMCEPVWPSGKALGW